MSGNDKQALSELPYRYARGCDTQDPAIFAAIFTEDGVIVSPAGTISGRDQIVDIVPRMLGEMYLRCMHFVGNVLIEIDGDEASGEAYCFAHHLTPDGEGQASDLVMSIKYSDSYRRVDGAWRFARRELALQWTETKMVQI